MKTMRVPTILAAGLLLAATATAEETAMHSAQGEFDVTVTPIESPESPFPRFALAKVLRGGLEATGEGEMIASGGPHEGSGAYVALERITGTLDGRRGSFVLQHRGAMDASGMDLLVTIVPGSGTDQLVGISGTFTIRFDGPNHLYELEYELPSH